MITKDMHVTVPTITNSSQSSIIKPRADRWHEFDVLKALAIIAVVLIHCISDGFPSDQSLLQALLSDLTRFAVPAFLFSAGFLFNKDRKLASGTLLSKIGWRILPPYLFCSILWIAYEILRGRLSFDPMHITEMLFLGKAHGIYYFVFVISYLYALGVAMRYFSKRAIWILWFGSLIAMISHYALFPRLVLPTFSLNAIFRSPFIHMLPFVTGWLVSLHYQRVRSWLGHLSPIAIAVVVIADGALLSVLVGIPDKSGPRDLLVQMHIYLWIFSVMAVSVRWKLDSKWIAYLSLSSYGIYLTHIVFVEQLHRLTKKMPLPDNALYIFLNCAIATVLTVTLLELVKRATGRYAEYLVGVKS